MSATLYEQFFAVGSVKSLLTGKEFHSPRPTQKAAEQAKEIADLPPKGKNNRLASNFFFAIDFRQSAQKRYPNIFYKHGRPARQN